MNLDKKEANFKKTALHIIPKCPMARKCNTKRNDANKVEVSLTGGEEALM